MGLNFAEILFILICLMITIILFFRKRKVEKYWNVTPYKYHWDIFNCKTMKCSLDKSYNCYKYCDKINHCPSQGRCRSLCLDYGDIQNENIRYSKSIFG